MKWADGKRSTIRVIDGNGKCVLQRQWRWGRCGWKRIGQSPSEPMARAELGRQPQAVVAISTFSRPNDSTLHTAVE